MSKKRNRHHSLSSILSRTSSSLENNAKPIFGANTTTSFYVPRRGSEKRHKVDLTDFSKEKVFNK